MTKHPYPAECPRMTEAQMLQFVDDWLAGFIVHSQGMRDAEIGMVFMPLSFMALSEAPKSYLDSVGLVWASRAADHHIGMAVNGKPIFTTCRLMHREDLPILADAIEREIERRKNRKL